MGAGLVIFLVLVVLFVVLGIVFLVVSGMSRTSAAAVPLPLPAETHGTNAVETFPSREPPPPRAQTPGTSARPEDPRRKALPRCPRCGSAIGYEDRLCSKCGTDLVRR